MGKSPRKWSKLAINEAIKGYLFILPAIALLVSLLFIPMLQGFGYSFTDFNILKSWDRNFNGFDNYVTIFNDKNFGQIVQNELAFAIGVTVVTVICSTLIALLLNRIKHCKNLVRAMVFMPWVLPEVVVGAIWRWLLNGDKGLINALWVDYLHLGDQYIQFFSEATALLSVSLVYIWRTYPYVTIMLSAGLQGIDKGLYEAASIDGCNAFQKFWFITIPNLKYILSICSLMAMIWTMNGFGILNILTSGGPGIASTTLPLVIYQTAFQKFRFGRASAYSVIQFVIIMIFAVIYLRITRATDEEDL